MTQDELEAIGAERTEHNGDVEYTMHKSAGSEAWLEVIFPQNGNYRVRLCLGNDHTVLPHIKTIQEFAALYHLLTGNYVVTFGIPKALAGKVWRWMTINRA